MPFVCCQISPKQDLWTICEPFDHTDNEIGPEQLRNNYKDKDNDEDNFGDDQMQRRLLAAKLVPVIGQETLETCDLWTIWSYRYWEMTRATKNDKDKDNDSGEDKENDEDNFGDDQMQCRLFAAKLVLGRIGSGALAASTKCNVGCTTRLHQ